MKPLDAVYARAVAAVPELAAMVDPGAAVLDAAVLTDPGWLAGRIAETGRRWRVADARVVGTLWWYSASSTLVAAPVTTLLVAGKAVDVAGLAIYLRPDGDLGGGRASGLLDGGPVRLGRALRESLGAVIAPLAAVSGATERALWAITADSLGNWALRAGTALGTVEQGTELAIAVARGIGAVMPVPRFVDIGTRRYVRRCSCCLIYVAPGCGKCTSCPRQTPDERLRRLTAHARSL